MVFAHGHHKTQGTPLQQCVQREEAQLEGRKILTLARTQSPLSDAPIAASQHSPRLYQLAYQFLDLVGFFPPFQDTRGFL